jgi:hypothetical protein
MLWGKLLASKKKDHQLLMLSGALGIQFAGSAIGQSVRQLTLGPLGRNSAVALVGSVMVVLSNVICLYLWWQALRRPVKEAAGCQPDARPRGATGAGGR